MNNKVAEIGEFVMYNGHIRNRLGAFTKNEMNKLKIGDFYEVINILTELTEYDAKDDHYYRLKCISIADIWYPHDGFEVNLRKFMIEKYNLI